MGRYDATDGEITLANFLTEIPGDICLGASDAGDDLFLMKAYAIRNLAIGVIGKDSSNMRDGGLVSTDGTSGSTIAVYRVDLTAGLPKAGGLWAYHAAAVDDVILGAGLWTGGAYDLAGADAVALTADGKTRWCALVAVRATAGVVKCAVYGAEANDGAELAITSAQIRTALDAALVATPAGPLAGLVTSSFVVFSRIKIQRVAVNTIVMTHTSAITDSGLLNERLGGTIGSLS